MPNFVKVAERRDLPPGERLVVEVEDGLFVAVFNVGGSLYAIKDVCTHDDGPLAEGRVDGHEIECPRHGARFDLRTGKVLSFPAITDVQWFEVKIEGEDVLVDMG